MEIKLKQIKIKEIAEGYKNNNDEGVVGFGGRLNIRPKYQREFIYDTEKQVAVIHSLSKGFPLNVMYWVENKDGGYELLDGQQRTMSICEYLDNNLFFEGRQFCNLTNDEQEVFLDRELMIYFCKGEEKEVLDWFEIINIAGEKLTRQELLNALFTGEWLTCAKRHFSKNNCVAYLVGKDYLKGSAIRQDYLETAIKWISEGKIREYMALHQHECNANELWLYFQSVINWVKAIFPKYRKEMKGFAWGELYNQFKDTSFDSVKLEGEISLLMKEDDIKNKSGIYPYVLTRKQKYLNIRTFSDNQKRTSYEKQQGICANCAKNFSIEQMEADHITPWHEGGKTTAENCQMLCRECNRRKGGK